METITNQREKNPGRVEWGRKLGKLSKQKKLEAPEQNPKTYTHYYIYGILIIGVVVGLHAYRNKYTKPIIITKETEKPKERTFANF